MNPDYFKNLQWLEPPPPDFRERMRSALSGDSANDLRRLAAYGLDEARLHQLGSAFVKARRNGKKWPDLTPFRLAFLSNGTTDHLIFALTATALRYGVDLDIAGVSYDEAYAAAVGGDEKLKTFAPDAFLIAIDYRGLPLREVFGRAEEEEQIVAECTAYLQSIYDGIGRNYASACLAQTLAFPPSASFGHADRAIAGSLRRIIDKVNHFISGAADTMIDIAALAEIAGTSQWFDAKLFHTGKIPFALPLVPLYADNIARVIGAMRGKSRRALVLDLDNTLWGGVVGDDGVEGIVIGNGSATGEAYLAFQRKALSLRKRGIVLAVSSKNDEEQARRPFREIPDMALKEDSFSSFHANWNDKAANIKAIAEELSLGLDAFVFVDDNPQERALVRTFLPQVAVPEMPNDPSLYPLVLDAAGYFEAVSFSDEDARRADLYRAQASMARLAPNDLGAYLASLEMKLVIDNVNAVNRARAVQLVNKSNQFNLTTRRLTDAEMQALQADAKFKCFTLRLTDTFDDHGIISVILCEKTGDVLSISLWVMSCRVIGRGIEKAVMGFLIEKARAWGCSCIKGQYVPTSRNQMVEKHYANLDFGQESADAQGVTNWLLQLDAATAEPARIEIINQTGA